MQIQTYIQIFTVHFVKHFRSLPFLQNQFFYKSKKVSRFIANNFELFCIFTLKNKYKTSLKTLKLH